MVSLVTLFFISFFAATIFPLGSEFFLLGLHAKGDFSFWVLLVVASVGNVLGSVLNYVLGRFLLHFQDRKWFPVQGKSIDKASGFYNKYGVWSLLLAWVPILGDPLTVLAGMFKVRFVVFLTLMSVGKIGRYYFLLSLF
jgi:membrane protein YqaA with SNARE-associated domain